MYRLEKMNNSASKDANDESALNSVWIIILFTSQSEMSRMGEYNSANNIETNILMT